MTRARPALWLAAALGIGCAGAPRSGARADAVVLITCNVAEAALFVDGRYLAPVGLLRGGVAVSPGRHRFELRHPAHQRRLLELAREPAERRAVAAELYPILP